MVPLLLALAAAALLAGMLAGLAAGWRSPPPFKLRTAFCVYLGLVGVVATTWAKSMDILPLALAYAALTGALPFAAMSLAARKLVLAWRGRHERG